MPSLTQLEDIRDRLNSYQLELATFSQALDALRVVADQIVAALRSDNELVASLVQAELSGTGQSPCNDQADTASTISLDGMANPASAALTPSIAPETPVPASTLDMLPAESADAETLHVTAPNVAAATQAKQDPLTSEETVTDLNAEATAAALRAIAQAAPFELDSQPVNTVAMAGSGSGAVADPTGALSEAAAPTASADGKVIDLVSRRRAWTPWRLNRRSASVAATLLIAVLSAAGVHELMTTELGQQLLELGTCDGDMLSANRNCALLAWLHL